MKDKRTKAELLNALDAVNEMHLQAKDAIHKMEIQLRVARTDKNAAEALANTRRQCLDRICHIVTTVVAMKYPQTTAFGTVEQVWYQGATINPGYEGDSEEVRLLKLIHEQCQEGSACST
jgi:hypothetical protein